MPSIIKTLPALAILASVGLSPAMAQTATTPPNGANATGNGATQHGVTSGPAAGRPATLGTGAVAPASPHQTDVTGSHGGEAIRGQHQGQQGGTQTSVRPGASDAGAGVH